MTKMRLRTLGVGTALALTSLLGAPAVAGAVTTTDDGAPATAEPPPRVIRACKRIPNLTIRTENVLARIQADADTIGSLLWLDGRIARADEAGRDGLAEVLRNRRGVREANIAVFEQRLDTLENLAERCRNVGVEL